MPSISAEGSDVVLEARQVTKVFAGTIALAGVDFQVRRGQVHALIGENGAGKSTLVKVLAGIEQPTTGELRLGGRVTRLGSAREAARLGIGVIHQELQLFPDLTVTENLFAGRERQTSWGTIARTSEEQATREVLARLGSRLSPRALVGSLPLGQRQIVEIARAFVHDVRVLMMDEPTSALTASEIPVLFQLIRDLTRHGVSVVYISHRLDELLAVADDLTVLRDGRVVGEAPRTGVDVPWIVERMTGHAPRRRRVAAPRDEAATPSTSAPSPTRRLRVDALCLPPAEGRTPLDAVSFDLAEGEILGLFGLMGAGRTELLESLLGVHADATGRVELDDRDLRPCDVSDRIAAGLAMVPEDRQASGLVQTFNVRENMTLSSLAHIGTRAYVSPARERAVAAPLAADLGIKPAGLETPVTALSGGNQQKVILARGVMSRPRVLLLDEPTRGVDVAAKAEILGSMRRLAADGMGIIFATSEWADVQAAATRVLVLARGRITADLGPNEATADALARAAAAIPGLADEGGRRTDGGR